MDADKLPVGAANDVKQKYGDITDKEFFKNLFKDGPALCAQTCTYLASGQGKELRGLYFGMCQGYVYLSGKRLIAIRLPTRRFEASRIWPREAAEREP
jgi:hypothetical protein